MTKRLIWNFEIQSAPSIDFSGLSPEEKGAVRWEARYFWNDQDTITLSGLEERFLDLSHYSYKKHHDRYFLLHEFDGNIKSRHDQLVYKPLVKRVDDYCGFEKKIVIDEDSPDIVVATHLELTTGELFNYIKTNTPVTVDKVAATWSITTLPKTKLELSRLIINKKTYFSLCIEGRSLSHVSTISKVIIKEKAAENYVDFLKKIQA